METSKPIIFTGCSIRAILSGEKTQTRRVINPQPLTLNADGSPIELDGAIPKARGKYKFLRLPSGNEYGPMTWRHGVGDCLWVREIWSVSIAYDEYPPSKISRHVGEVAYKAGGGYHFESDRERGRWRPPIFMPRWASRISLEVTDVRVQRLQEITDPDAEAEGVLEWRDGPTGGYNSDNPQHCGCIASPVECFANMWDEINGKKYPWENDPWIWKISFKRVEP